MPRLRLPVTLTGRLVLTVVGLVAVAGLLISASTTLVLRHYLTGQFDHRVQEAAGRAERFMDGDHEGLRPDGDEPGPGGSVLPGDETGDLTVVVNGSLATGNVFLPTENEPYRRVPLTQAQLGAVTRKVADLDRGDMATVSIEGLGRYRLAARPAGGSTTIVSGLPLANLDRAVSTMLWAQLLLTAAAVGAAAMAGDFLVRRTLRPLREVASTAHEVAALPLDTGEVGRTARVPDRLTDPQTEVGQVGAALNRLLGHVEGALDARHRSEQQVRQFVADASHELRTPLATIMGYAELARRSPSYSPADALAKVEEEGVRMRGLVEDLLLLARLDAGRPLARDQVDLTKLALEAVEDARVVASGHHWVLELPEEPVTVTGDDQRLHQVLANLLTNARRHTPLGTTVRVGLGTEADRAVLTVTDNGPGIPSEVREKVFERFTRGDTSRTRDSGGAGLGLALVDAIVTAHGGTVGVRSSPGHTAFSVSLPLERTPQPATAS